MRKATYALAVLAAGKVREAALAAADEKREEENQAAWSTYYATLGEAARAYLNARKP